MAQKTRSTTEETTPQQGNALPPIVHCWCLRLLTEFKREDRLIDHFGLDVLEGFGCSADRPPTSMKPSTSAICCDIPGPIQPRST